MKRKLIEVAIPLEAINSASFAEKNRKVGKPQNLHQWWSRKPITAARAMLLAQLIDDPSSNPEKYPTDAAVEAERARLHALIARAVEWEEVVSPSAELLGQLSDLLPKVTVTDPFVGGGSIPLAAAQLGVDSESSDLNPVAALLAKALVEVPSVFSGRPPVNPQVESRLTSWVALEGLAADVEAYGRWVLAEARKQLAAHYPPIDGAPTLAWVWARGVTCPNPACRITVPLVSKWWLAKKKGKEAFIRPSVEASEDPSGRRFTFSVSNDISELPTSGIMSGRTGTTCLNCGSAVSISHIREEGQAGRMTMLLTAVVGEGPSGRLYRPASDEHVHAASVSRPEPQIHGEIASNPRWFSPPFYGIREFDDLFTDRQLLAMATFSELVGVARTRVLADAIAGGAEVGVPLSAGGDGAEAYADAVLLYLALAVSRLANWSNNQCSWEANGEVSQQMYSGQAMGMAWDVSEANVLGEGNSGSFLACLKNIVAPLRAAHPLGKHRVGQADARAAQLRDRVVATDPPYFDNIDYSDLSDFFYVWQRRMLADSFPDLFKTLLVPKGDELVANAYRAGGEDAAAASFLSGFVDVFAHFRASTSPEFPVVVYYASKQAESLGAGNSRWSTILQAMIETGWQIVRTWPIRTENVSRRVAIGNNSMATSTVLVLRPRPSDAERISLSEFLAALRASLRVALVDLENAGVAPVDMQQTAIGPGIETFSRYRAVLGPDGRAISVSEALLRINEVVDEMLNEQEGSFDPPTRFAIQWYRYHGYVAGPFGDADDLARSRNTSVDAMNREGILSQLGGKVQLLEPGDLPAAYDPLADRSISHWEILHHAIRKLETGGVEAAGELLAAVRDRSDGGVEMDLIRDLGHLLFHIAEGSDWTKDALRFNSLVTSWAEVSGLAAELQPIAVQGSFDLFGEDANGNE